MTLSLAWFCVANTSWPIPDCSIFSLSLCLSIQKGLSKRTWTGIMLGRGGGRKHQNPVWSGIRKYILSVEILKNQAKNWLQSWDTMAGSAMQDPCLYVQIWKEKRISSVLSKLGLYLPGELGEECETNCLLKIWYSVAMEFWEYLEEEWETDLDVCRRLRLCLPTWSQGLPKATWDSWESSEILVHSIPLWYPVHSPNLP